MCLPAWNMSPYSFSSSFSFKKVIIFSIITKSNLSYSGKIDFLGVLQLLPTDEVQFHVLLNTPILFLHDTFIIEN